ncbi:MAG TPA: response regulator transcription factor [Burkholderiales bacterium]|nr:response regulator transcription factor [Burkholderiales bacterium]
MKPTAQYSVTQSQCPPRAIHLTPRELEVLALLCEGLPNKLISRRLEISSATVKCHISRILSELGVSSRLQAVVAAARYGLLADHHTATPNGGNPAASRDESSRSGIHAPTLHGFFAAAA